MEIGVKVGAAVLDDGEAEIVVGGFEQSGEDNAAGCNAEEDKRVNIVGAENHSEVSSREGTDAMFGDDNFTFFGRNCSGNRSEWSLKQFLMLD